MTLELPDRLLVARVLRGDEEAFSALFHTSFGPLFRFALPRLGGDEDAAEEVVQTTLCRAIRKLATWRGEAALLTWLTTICRREIADHYERRRKVPPMLDLTEDVPEIRAALESLGVAGAQAEADRKEIARLVQTILDRLPPRWGEALEWKYLDGLSVSEIASRLGVGPKAAESTLTRARQGFRDAFVAAYGDRGIERQERS